jgi:hypothetical protein
MRNLVNFVGEVLACVGIFVMPLMLFVVFQ